MTTDEPHQDTNSTSDVALRAGVVERVARETETDPEIVEELIEVVRQEFHRGPLPAPETFAQYEAICPGAAGEILGMAVRAQRHSHEMDRSLLTSEANYRRLAILLAAGLVGLMIVGAVICAVSDHNAAAISLGAAAGLASVAGVFIRGRDLFGNTSDEGDPTETSPIKAAVPSETTAEADS